MALQFWGHWDTSCVWKCQIIYPRGMFLFLLLPFLLLLFFLSGLCVSRPLFLLLLIHGHSEHKLIGLFLEIVLMPFMMNQS